MNIGLHGGITEEKHYNAMGDAIWLYMWLIHRQTRRNGLVLGGSPITYSRIHSETKYPIRTMKRWMSCLKTRGYIEVSYLNFKMMRIRILKPKKHGKTQIPLPMEQGPNVALSGTGVSAKSGPRVGPNVALSGTKNGPSKQKHTMSSNETPETPRAMPDGIAGIVPIPVWLSFVKMRRAIGKPLSEGDADLFVRRLVEFQSEGQDPIAILEQSIMSRWAGIFPVKGKTDGGTKSDQRAERTDTALDRVFGKPQKVVENIRRALPSGDH